MNMQAQLPESVRRAIEEASAEAVDKANKNLSPNVEQQIKDALDAAGQRSREEHDDYRSGRRAPTPANDPLQRFVPGPVDHATGRPYENGDKFKSFGEYLVSVHNSQFGRHDPRLEGSQNIGIVETRATGLSEGIGADGGFLVPDEFRAQLLQNAMEEAVVRPRATVIPMAGDLVKIPRIDESSRASTVFGGVQAYWVGEGATLTASQPTLGSVELRSRKLVGLTYSTTELLQDSAIGLEALLFQLFGRAIGWFEDDGFLSGNGAGQPLGIQNSPARVTVAKETSQAATTVVYENVVKMRSRIMPTSYGRAVWVANSDTIPQLMTMNLAVGTGGAAMWVQSSVPDMPDTLLGRPIVYTEHAQTLGTAGDIMLADFSQYLIGDRMDLRIDSSMHQQFTTDEICWRFVKRVDGQPWMISALTPQNGSNTLSPFVELAVRS